MEKKKRFKSLVGSEFNKTYETNSGLAKILKYTDTKNVTVQFESGEIVVTCMSSLRKGNVKSRTFPSVYGIGYIGIGEHISYHPETNKKTICYNLWQSMLQRCYSEKQQQSVAKTYKDVTVDSRWHNFQNFAEWFEKEKDCGYYQTGWQLDKDLSSARVYSPEVCLFLPRELNRVFKTSRVKSMEELKVEFLEKAPQYQINPKYLDILKS